MSVYDKTSPMNDILVRGEEARRRRSRKRRLHSDDSIPVDSANVRFRRETELEPQDKQMASNHWFKEMICYPSNKELSMMEVFTVLSAVAVYLPIGLILLLFPKQSCTMVYEHCSQSQGFFRVFGIQICSIAFLYIIFSRVSGKFSSQGIIFGTVFSRIVYTIGCLYLLYVRKFLSTDVVYYLAAIDVSTSLVTLVFWIDASFKQFFESIWQLIRPSNPSVHASSGVVRILGFIQSILGVIFFTFPNLAFLVFRINRIDNFAKGSLFIGFMYSANVGFIHVLSGGADSKAYNFSTVFYRMFIIPVFFYMGSVGQIQFALAMYHVLLDSIFALITFIVLLSEPKIEC